MTALLDAEHDVDRLELGAQILGFPLMVALDLLEHQFELGLRSLDVLTDRWPPALAGRSEYPAYEIPRLEVTQF